MKKNKFVELEAYSEIDIKYMNINYLLEDAMDDATHARLCICINGEMSDPIVEFIRIKLKGKGYKWMAI